MLQMLSAPLLNEVEIVEGRLTESEALELTKMVRSKSILNNIKNFSWRDDSHDSSPPFMELLMDTLQVTFPHIDYPRKFGALTY
jgi:hypothetical protein